ncbi:MAG TPA: hypoxanthine phosphoribosyltransferase [Chloroflexia bacterium]|nr:hypoxanthine phosphoribosyltransferase [Chloroflexia bacterium]
MPSLADDMAEILIDQSTLQAKIRDLAAEINRDYAGKEVMLVGVLKGAIMFMVDLARMLDIPVTLDFMAISSYGQSTVSSGVVRILKDLDASIEGKHILIVEDIVDSGLTLSYLVDYLKGRNPASLKICVLLNKPDRRKSDVPVDYLGFDIPDKFVVGYGLDYAEIYRNLPFIGVLKPELYTT